MALLCALAGASDKQQLPVAIIAQYDGHLASFLSHLLCLLRQSSSELNATKSGAGPISPKQGADLRDPASRSKKIHHGLGIQFILLQNIILRRRCRRVLELIRKMLGPRTVPLTRCPSSPRLNDSLAIILPLQLAAKPHNRIPIEDTIHHLREVIEVKVRRMSPLRRRDHRKKSASETGVQCSLENGIPDGVPEN